MDQVNTWEDGNPRLDSENLFEINMLPKNDSNQISFITSQKKLKWIIIALVIGTISLITVLSIGIWYFVASSQNTFNTKVDTTIKTNIENNKLVNESNFIKIYKNMLKKEPNVVIDKNNVVEKTELQGASIANLQKLMSSKLNYENLDNKYLQIKNWASLVYNSRLSQSTLEGKYFKLSDKENFKTEILQYLKPSFGDFAKVQSIKNKTDKLDENYASIIDVKRIQNEINIGRLSNTKLDERYASKNLLTNRLSTTALDAKYLLNTKYNQILNNKLSETTLDNTYYQNSLYDNLFTGEGRLSETTMDNTYINKQKLDTFFNYKKNTDDQFLREYYKAFPYVAKAEVTKLVNSIVYDSKKVGSTTKMGVKFSTGKWLSIISLLQGYMDSEKIVHFQTPHLEYIFDHPNLFEFVIGIGDNRNNATSRFAEIHLPIKGIMGERKTIWNKNLPSSTETYTFVIDGFTATNILIKCLHNGKWDTEGAIRSFKIINKS